MIDLGLARVFRLLARVPLPWRAIHVAGTNGKGSICAYVSAMLSTYNNTEAPKGSGQKPLKHGRFTSPHLIDRWDCITINGKTISESIFRQVEARVMARDKAENIQATEFELLTATAFEIFTQESVDIGVIEVGMGGRLDATNVLGQLSGFEAPHESGLSLDQFRPKPLMTAISTIALDHQGFLGNTLEEIATQKAGIMKKDVPVVLAPNPPSVIQHLTSIAKEVQVSEVLHAIDAPGYERLRRDHSATSSAINAAQVRDQNSAIAFMITWQSLNQLNRLSHLPPTALENLTTALQAAPLRTVWPGRIQDISIECVTGYKPLILIDGAHNAESATALANTVHERVADQQRPVTWVVAASAGKDIKAMLKLFLSTLPDSQSLTPSRANQRCANVIATEFGAVDGMPWVKAMKAEDVFQEAQAVTAELRDTVAMGELHVQKGLKDALGLACSLALPNNGLVVVAGSLYLVGDVMRLVRDHGGEIA